MQGLWGNFWARTFITAGIVFVLNLVIAFWPVVFFLGGTYGAPFGVLDFAGGAVIHVSVVGWLFPVWCIAEIYFWRRKSVPLFGSYLIFLLAFCVSQYLVSCFLYVSFTSSQAYLIFNIISLLAGLVAGIIPAYVYQSMRSRSVGASRKQ